MEKIIKMYADANDNLIRFINEYGILLLRVCMGVIFIWFGLLKFFPGMSSAAPIAAKTIDVLTFGLVPSGVGIIILALLETLIGVGFLTGKFLRITILLFVAQMIGANSPLVLLPTETFKHFPYVPNLEGQYMIKNIVLIIVALLIWVDVHNKETKPGAKE